MNEYEWCSKYKCKCQSMIGGFCNIKTTFLEELPQKTIKEKIDEVISTNAPKVEYEIPTIDSMEALAKEFKQRRKKIPIGFTVNPSTMRFLKENIPDDNLPGKYKHELIPYWKGIKVYEAKKQINNCIPFYDKEKLKKHLKNMNEE